MAANHKNFCNTAILPCSQMTCDACESVFNAATELAVKNLTSANSGNSKNVTQQANTAIALLKKWRDCANDDLWRETMLFLAQIAQQHRQRDEIKPDCGNCLLAGQCTYFGFPSDSCSYSARV